MYERFHIYCEVRDLRILIDIGHPAHVHFFKNAVKGFRDSEHDVLITSRKKDCALDLLDELGLRHRPISEEHSGSVVAMARELLVRNWRLLQAVREFRPDVMTGVGGIFVSQVGLIMRVPTVVFYDTENAVLQNMLTFPFAHRVVVPDCYRGRTPKKRTLKYRGYHELAYLHDSSFTPNRDTALEAGLADSGNTFLIRIVSWQANHDLGDKGWSESLLRAVVRDLSKEGKVIISSEVELPPDLNGFRYLGSRHAMHHLIAFCRATIVESATVASESAILGTPSIFAANNSRGYVDDISSRYGLIKITNDITSHAISKAFKEVLSVSPSVWQGSRKKLISDTINVTELVQRAIWATVVSENAP